MLSVCGIGDDMTFVSNLFSGTLRAFHLLFLDLVPMKCATVIVACLCVLGVFLV